MATQRKNKFQPMPASFGLVPELAHKIKDKKLRYVAYKERSLEALKSFKKLLENSFEKDQFLAEIN
jgi:folate-dependent tRNA-U54 methylase TrmFO/GidA